MTSRFLCLALAGAVLGMLGCSEKVAPSTAVAAEPDVKKHPDLHDSPFKGRVKAPDLSGGVGWINTSGPLELKQLRGKFVLLDFWTYCCINCMHILPELKKLEHKYPNELVVIGVHTAKFDTEKDSANIIEAVKRYEIQHPVVNDARQALWDKYGINSWPTIILIDPEGYAIWGNNGETPFATLDGVMTKAVAYYKRKGLVDETPLQFDLESAKAVDTPLRYPGKVVADEASGRLFIADSNHNRIVVARLDGTLLDVIGHGEVGTADGDYTAATFNHPQGMAVNGQTLYVADTENHLLRKVDLDKKSVKTIAGRGVQARPTMHDLREAAQHRKPLLSTLNSPWDLLIHDKSLYVAMAGPHQIWRMPLDESEIAVYAGNGREDIVDGPLLAPVPYESGFASFAQPSGLTTDGTSLFVADSEGSSIRSLPFFGHKGKVTTILGTAHLGGARLFTFGDVDGQGDRVRFQHPLGVAWDEGKLYVADTYNSRIKQVDVAAETSTTIAGARQAGSQDAADGLNASFDEPAGISAAHGKLYVADTNNHRIRTVDVARPHAVATLDIVGLEPPMLATTEPTSQSSAHVVTVAAVTLRPTDGAIRLSVSVELPTGWKINPIAPMRYKVEPLTATGVVERSELGKFVKLDKPSPQFEVRLPVTSQVGADRIRVTLQYYYCQESNEGLCKASNIAWEVPIQLSADGPSALALLTAKAP